MIDDLALLRRYVDERSETAFAELVARHLKLVYFAALRQTGHNPGLAEDVSQEVFADLARKARTLVDRPVLTGWLYTSTRYAALNATRAERRRQQREQEAHAMHAQQADSPDWAAIRPVIDDALHALDEREREAVLLRFFEGWMFADIGARFALTEEAARKRVERALDKMQAVLARRGVTSTSAALGIALAHQAALAAPAGLAATISGSALAAAAVPELGLISFMSTTKTLVGAAVIGLLALGLGLHQQQRTAQLDAAVMAATERQGTAQRQLEALRRRSQAMDQSLAEAQKLAATPRATPTAAPAMPTLPVPPARDIEKEKADWRLFVAAHPEAHAVMVEKYKDQIRMGSRSFFLLAGLSSEQIDTLLTRAAESAAQNAALSPTIDLPIEGGNTLAQFVQRPELMRGVVDDQIIAQARDFLRLNPAGQLAGLVRQAAVQGVPELSPEQEVRLARLIASHSPDYRNGQMVNPGNVDWAAVQQEAQGILSPPQIKAAGSVFTRMESIRARQQILGPLRKQAERQK